MEGAQLERGLEAHKNTARGTTLLGGEFPVEDWEQHYKEVRNRLNGIKPMPKQIEVIIPPAELLVLPEPPPPPPLFSRDDMLITQGCSRDRVRCIVLPILRKHKMTWRQLVGQCRTKPHILLRREAWFALVSNGYGIAETGRLCGRDHTTILHAIKQWKLNNGTEYRHYLIDEGDDARILSGAINYIADAKAKL
ncbi:Chromosomal replication initiator, DnaA C-terminal [uncultured Caudovirales phage]|uniref:Chromosomal replication initiator, DnaA C-terminal n=1 Tax=uncultured Caudovirales phage TaxID=2100421 RepID=A0A6J5PJR0_9CAUD|nr:Chromosomal replication initiator, DnaA C-terminal [uncultured Caudovirales phage]CAB4177648.1 Chromosomal replication initiator, DnaA C-terminal [uncultured Caudovirales phage]CAB4202300.1 Chromosomal replication initiator, DnaA C-terminal [uncultured Caudovirales phage]CAB5229180.1 Chromosomal replication initiator, DnaA C-terminal [uncultured Caudovirales phage]